MNRVIKIALPIILSIATLVVSNSSYATYYNRDAFFSGNGLPDLSVGALVYYVDSSASNYGYEGYSLDARTEFDKVEDSVMNFRRATSTEVNTAKLRYWAMDTDEYIWYGRVYAYDAYGAPFSSDAAQESGAWSKVDVKYNHYRIKNAGLSPNSTKRVAVHELGHVMSMKHQPIGGYYDLPSVMQEQFKGIESWTLTSTDVSNLQYMY